MVLGSNKKEKKISARVEHLNVSGKRLALCTMIIVMKSPTATRVV